MYTAQPLSQSVSVIDLPRQTSCIYNIPLALVAAAAVLIIVLLLQQIRTGGFFSTIMFKWQSQKSEEVRDETIYKYDDFL